MTSLFETLVIPIISAIDGCFHSAGGPVSLAKRSKPEKCGVNIMPFELQLHSLHHGPSKWNSH